MTSYHHLLRVVCLSKRTWKLCHCAWVLFRNGFRINTDGREEKNSRIKQRQKWNWEAASVGPQLRSSEVWITLLYSWVGVRKPGLIHLFQSIIECGPAWEGGRTLDEMVFASWGNPQRGPATEDRELSAGSATSTWGIQSFILEGGSRLHFIASMHHPTGWNHNSLI